jgi:polyisoprenoid-binding protein YceI
MEFVSTGARVDSDDFFIDGDLTIRGITKPVSFAFDFGGFGTDPYGNYKAGASATTTINREDFGLTWNAALETGGVLVGKDITINLDLQGALQQD